MELNMCDIALWIDANIRYIKINNNSIIKAKDQKQYKKKGNENKTILDSKNKKNY